MRILVSGAAGFIGWNLTRELRARHPDAEIVGVDSLWTGVRRVPECVDRMAETDICLFWDTGEFDYVYHLASPASPQWYQSDPLRTIRANVDGLIACLHFLAPGGTLFFSSSSEVYGDPLVSPQPEDYKGSVSCVGPRACYDEAKRLCETICVEWGRSHPEHRVKIARLFNVYGPGTLPDDGRCVSNFIWESMHGRPIKIYGDGLQTRCFTYVDNVVGAIVRLVEETDDFIGPVNIGTDVESTVRDVACAVLAQVGRWQIARGREWNPPTVEYVAAAVEDPRQRLPDLKLAERVLRWNPRRLIPLWGDSGGIARTIRYFEHDHLEPEESEIENDRVVLENSHKISK